MFRRIETNYYLELHLNGGIRMIKKCVFYHTHTHTHTSHKSTPPPPHHIHTQKSHMETILATHSLPYLLG